MNIHRRRRHAAAALQTAFALLLWCPGLASASESGAPELSVAEFVANHPAAGEYILIAYDEDIYLCPPCPKGAQCKPSIGDNFTITDTPPRAGTPGKERIMVFSTPSDLAKLQIGRRYRLRIRVAGSLRLRGVEHMP
jgi:hypothetical protein